MSEQEIFHIWKTLGNKRETDSEARISKEADFFSTYCLKST